MEASVTELEELRAFVESIRDAGHENVLIFPPYNHDFGLCLHCRAQLLLESLELERLRAERRQKKNG